MKKEYRIVDRTSFRSFLGIAGIEEVSVGRTVRKYREALTAMECMTCCSVCAKEVTTLLTEEGKGKHLYLDTGYVGKDDGINDNWLDACKG